MPSTFREYFKRRWGRKRNLEERFLENNTLCLCHCGEDFFKQLKKLIDGAEHIIHLQTYDFSDDHTGEYIAKALTKAAERNVAVYVLADGYASQKTSKQFVERLQNAGVKFRFFEPLMKSKHFYFGRRLHHKVAVADGLRALVGSMNIADRYNDIDGSRAWLDMAVYIEGESCAVLHEICWEMWGRRRKKGSKQLPAPAKKDINPQGKKMLTRVSRNDWVMKRLEVYRTYSALFRLAEKNITIVCSYFLPGRPYRNLLKKASARGVKVRVVLAGTSDVKTAKYAERYLYRWLLRNKIEVYEFKPTVLHAKMAIVDGKYVTMGSYNLNQLSHWASIELNIDIKDEGFAEHTEKEIQQIIDKECDLIDLSSFNTPFFSFTQFAQWICYYFLRFLVMVSTFYYRQKE